MRKRGLSFMMIGSLLSVGARGEVINEPQHSMVATQSISRSLPSIPAAAPLSQPFVELGAMDSTADESLESFLLRAGGILEQFTERTGYEGCGSIQQSVIHKPLHYRIRLTTNLAHAACALMALEEPGFERFGPDLHSHPYLPKGTLTNAQDFFYNPDIPCGTFVQIYDKLFSLRDLRRGPGYMVSRGLLLYQNGSAASMRVIGAVMPGGDSISLQIGSGERALQKKQEQLAVAAEAAWSNQSDARLPVTQCK
jgi:hypothetical protein